MDKPLDVQLHDLAPRVTRSSSSCANVSTVASAAPIPAASRASFEGYSSRITSSVLPSVSSKVTVVTEPLSTLSSFVNGRKRESDPAPTTNRVEERDKAKNPQRQIFRF